MPGGKGKHVRGERNQAGEVLPFPEQPRPAPRIVLWEKRLRPVEDDLRNELGAQGYQALKWSSEPGQVYLAHAHIYPELLWVLRGSVTVVLAASRRMLELGPGDRIEMPPGTMHALLAGPDGAEYLIGTHLDENA
jgi:quercetin dioxygenase-like cupin family protein